MRSFMVWPAPKISLGSQTKKHEMDGTHARRGEDKKNAAFWWETPKRAHLEDLDIDGKTIIKSTLECWTGFSGGIL
jgi:hypothetical protein